MIKPYMWNTWDVNYLNAVSYLPDGLEVRFGLHDEVSGSELHQFLWDNIHRIGEHATNGSYCYAELKWDEDIVGMEYASEGDFLVCRITPRRISRRLNLIVDLFYTLGNKGKINRLKGTALKAKDFMLFSPNVVMESTKGEKDALTFALLDEPIYICCFRDDGKKAIRTKEDMKDFISRQRCLYNGMKVSGNGPLAGYADAIIPAVAWNTIWEPINKEICTVFSKELCARSWGGYAIAKWDTFFIALLSAIEDEELAYCNINAAANEITERGLFPDHATLLGKSEDRSQPPVEAYTILKLYKTFQRKELLERYFPKLLRAHKWWMKYRDGNGDGLLEWGSDPIKGPFGYHDIKAAKDESGMDNSPMYDDVKFNKDTNTMELIDVGLNSLYALNAWALSVIAEKIGKKKEAVRLKD